MSRTVEHQTGEPNVIELLELLTDRHAAEYATDVSEVYEVIERTYNATLGMQPAPGLAASTNDSRPLR